MALKTLEDYLSPGGQLPLESTEPEALEQFFQMQPETAEDVTPTDFPLAPLAPGKLSSMSLARPQAPRTARPTAIVAPPAPKALESGVGEAPALPPVTGEEAQYKAREDLARSQQGLERLAQRERVLKTLGIEPGKTRTRGALSLTGGATQFPVTPEGEPTRVEVPTRRVNAKDGITVTAPAGEGKPEAPAKVPVPGAGGDEGLDNLALGELITRGIGAVYQGATGRQVGGNIPEMLAAVRQRREAQAQREREIGAEQARQEQLFSQQRGIKSMEIEAEQAKESRKEEQNRRNNELELNTAIERNPEYKDSLENLRGYTGKGDVFKRFMDMALSDIRAGKLKTDQEIARAKAPAQIEGLEATAELKAEKAKTEAVEREKRRAEIDYLRTKAENEKGVRAAKTESDARKEFNKANNSKTGGELKSAATAFDALAKFDKDFVFGRAPEWLGELDFATAERAPALAPRARQLRTRMEAALAPIRKALFGASLTGTEKASFDLVSNTGQLLTTPVALIADAINTLRIAAARQTQDYYNSFLNDYPAMTTRNLSTSEVYKDVLKPDGVYGDIFTLTAPAAAATKPPKPVAPAGKVVLWNKKAGAWRAFDPETAERGKAAGALEE